MIGGAAIRPKLADSLLVQAGLARQKNRRNPGQRRLPNTTYFIANSDPQTLAIPYDRVGSIAGTESGGGPPGPLPEKWCNADIYFKTEFFVVVLFVGLERDVAVELEIALVTSCLIQYLLGFCHELFILV